MRTIKFAFVGLLLLSLAISISSFIPAKKATKASSSVSGGGTAVEGDAKSTFVFNAVENENGVHGFLQYNFRNAGISIRMNITCFEINGNRATLSGEIINVTGDNTSFPWVFEGQHASFTVEDNGNGKSQDKISDLLCYSGASCNDNWNTYLTVSGNISITP